MIWEQRGVKWDDLDWSENWRLPQKKHRVGRRGEEGKAGEKGRDVEDGCAAVAASSVKCWDWPSTSCWALVSGCCFQASGKHLHAYPLKALQRFSCSSLQALIHLATISWMTFLGNVLQDEKHAPHPQWASSLEGENTGPQDSAQRRPQTKEGHGKAPVKSLNKYWASYAEEMSYQWQELS